MAHEGIFATKAEIDVRVGANVGVGYIEANINDACAQSESFINVLCRYNYSDNYSTLNVDVRRILSEASACMVAQFFISYDMSGYTSRIEAEDMLNLLDDRLTKCLSLLVDQKNITFMNNA